MSHKQRADPDILFDHYVRVLDFGYEYEQDRHRIFLSINADAYTITVFLRGFQGREGKEQNIYQLPRKSRTSKPFDVLFVMINLGRDQRRDQATKHTR